MARTICSSGIVLVAHTRPEYVAEAVAMAWSVRRNSPGIPIALATDVSDAARFKGLFDHVVEYDFNGKSGVSFKMWLDEITPFQGPTLFLDSDAFVFRDLGFLFDTFADSSFAPTGRWYPEVNHWFSDCAAVMERFGMERIAFFIGDFYLFDQSKESTEVFRRARDILSKYDEFGINRLHGGFNDEPVFALAMHEVGVPIEPRSPDQIVALENKEVVGLRTNVLEGRAECQCAGVQARPAIVHYGSYRSQPAYFRERLRVEREFAGKGRQGNWAAELSAKMASFKFRASRRLRRFQRSV